ncbi:MAG: hypothetical protein HYS51_01000 [Candidatus Zambryskibacteria bacterium]|nr:hypothetical protein [Candidatus Zambryskibacteria bacterium]
MDEQNTNMNQPSGSSSGPIVGIIIILIVIILAGLYFWGQRGSMPNDTNAENTEVSTESISTQSDSDDAASIENDLNNTDLEVDTEINAS